MTSSSSWKPFLLGSLVTYSLLRYVKTTRIKQSPKEEERTTTTTTNDNNENNTSQQQTQAQTKVIMDAPDLDQRMIRKAEAVLQSRTDRLYIIIERHSVHDYNYTAILRTVEALGIQHVWIVNPSSEEEEESGNHHLFARKATDWLTVREFENVESCLEALREDGRELWVADTFIPEELLCDEEEKEDEKEEKESNREEEIDSISLTIPSLASALNLQPKSNNSLTLPPKLALLISTAPTTSSSPNLPLFLQSSTLSIHLPLVGHQNALNISIATALLLHSLMSAIDPTIPKTYHDQQHLMSLRKAWYAKLASNRILTSAQKKQYRLLKNAVKYGQQLEDKVRNNEFIDDSQKKKLKALPSKLAKLQKLENTLQQQSEKAVEKLIQNIPDPLSDLRRADEHRVCFVGRGTKKKHGEAWSNMPATGVYKTDSVSVGDGGSSAFFRGKIQE